MFEQVLHVIWFLIAGFFFLLALWSWLEKVSGKKRQERPGDFVRQGVFVLVCALVSLMIDKYMLKGFIESIPFVADFPLGMYQVLLFPCVLFIAARVIGPTKDIMIGKAPTPSSRGKK